MDKLSILKRGVFLNLFFLGSVIHLRDYLKC